MHRILRRNDHQRLSLCLSLKRFGRCAFFAAAAAAFSGAHAKAQGLVVTYGAKGVQTLAYNGVVLENTTLFSADAFHIWHMKATDLSGNTVTNGQYGWGENNNGTSWNAQTKTETYSFTWGTVATQFVQNGNNLDLVVTETNYASSGIIFDGAEIYPFALHFPKDPVGFSGNSQYAITTTDPGVSAADFGSGIVTSVIPNESLALYGGWKAAGSATYTPVMTGTTPDGLATFFPHNDLPVGPGTSLTYTVSLRFTPEGTPAAATDAYSSFASTYPSQMTWADKRIIGTAYLASSPAGTGDVTQPGGFPTNPRRYFNDASVDITTAAGLRTFQNRILAQAASDVANAQNMSAQGVITWDIEGEQYPQTTSYVCSPDQIGTVAPEMESAVSDPSSAFYGQKLDDAYFKTLSNAGLKIGLCLRPQVFTLGASSTASQVFLGTNAAIVKNLEAKARYANTRWGANIFYVDSTVDTNGGTLDPAIFGQLITDLPGFLFIPEESTTRYYAYTAPFYSFVFHTTVGTAASVYNTYPHAFGANLVNDVASSTLSAYQPQLTQAVLQGDILMGHADYWQANDPVLVAIYKAAGVTAPAPSQTTPQITWPTPTSISYGTALSVSQLNATSSVAGSFTYTPAAGTVLTAGTHSLQVSFAPTNTTAYKTTSATVTLTVAQALPTVTWAKPASVPAGSTLSGTQLNATASVPGTFAYTPAAGTTLSAGTYQLSVTFTPTDATDYASATSTQTLTVNAATVTPVITWPAPANIVSSTALSTTQLDAAANVPGTFTYSPVAGTLLTAGQHTLSATFTPTDTTRYAKTTATQSITVLQTTQIVLSLSKGPSTDIPLILTATATASNGSTVTGNVTLLTPQGGVIAYGSLLNGSASWLVPASLTSLTALAQYGGNGTFAPAVSNTLSGPGAMASFYSTQ